MDDNATFLPLLQSEARADQQKTTTLASSETRQLPEAGFSVTSADRQHSLWGIGELDIAALILYNVIYMVGEFEYLILTAVARLQHRAYGAAISKEIEETIGRRCSVGALYITLDRLESKGLITTFMGDPTPQRGGRPKRMVRITAEGARTAGEFYAGVTRMTKGVSWA